MKKLFITALVAVSLMSSAFASPAKDVNYYITNSFASSFPKANEVQWKVTAEYTKASFLLNNVKTEAFYNVDGDLIATSHAISINDMPTSVKRSFAKKYIGYTVIESIQFDGAGSTAYYISAKNDNSSVILKATNGSLAIVKQ